jgi:hypothetical protein
MKEQTIEVTKNYNIKTDGIYCMYSFSRSQINYFKTGTYDITIRCSYLDNKGLHCDLFDKDLKETKEEKIKRCKDCRAAKIIKETS